MNNAEKLRSIADGIPSKKAILLSNNPSVIHPLIILLMDMIEKVIRNTDIPDAEDASEKIDQLNQLIDQFMKVCL
ncbi:MAG: hypothetical protein E7249_14760 [Paenibacillaceae bacterium]|nr:hypothetical protein [Paenibacillaceae bacterium]